MELLIVVDMQNDFIDGALGSPEAQRIVPYVEQLIKNWPGIVMFTQDTHSEQYGATQEGQLLPIEHCIKGHDGWHIHESLVAALSENRHNMSMNIIEKPCFGSLELVTTLQECDDEIGLTSITIVGLCTDICVVSNALLVKAGLSEVPVYIDAAGCAGSTPEKHKAALEVLRSCQCHIMND